MTAAAEFAAWTAGILSLLGIIGVGIKVLLVLHREAKRLEAIELLATELAPNSGTSIKDTVHRTEQSVRLIHSRLDDHHDRLTKTEAKVEALLLRGGGDSK